jgi:hypothetical protein
VCVSVSAREGFYRDLKGVDSPADSGPVTTFSAELWVVLGLLGLLAVLTMLGRLAAAIDDEKRAFEAQQEALRLKKRYAAQLAAQQSDEVIEVDVIEDEPPAKIAA